jgi:hypothetical protein
LEAAVLSKLKKYRQVKEVLLGPAKSKDCVFDLGW